MRRNTIGLVFAGLSLLVASSLTAAAPVGEDSHPVKDLRHAAPRSPEAIPSLIAGEEMVFGREDGSALIFAAGDDPVMRLLEVEGKEIVVRLTPTDRAGADLGSGRVVVVGPSEKREVRLRDEFMRETLDGVQLRIEVLQGAGRIALFTTEKFGRGLQPQVEPAVIRQRPVKRGVIKTSEDLIDAAEVSGALNSETALLYRVYALFSDARLPAQYRGNDSSIKDSLYMGEVRERFATLSPATQEALLPFLTPPAYPGSWATPAGKPSVSTNAEPPRCDFFSDTWAFVEAVNTPVRVWYRPGVAGDFANAGAISLEIDTKIWPKLAGLMTPAHLPISDGTENCNGGNSRLDIYLADVSPSITTPYRGCANTPVFILLKRTSGKALATHEIFHAMQYSFPLAGCITDKSKYRWWAEASAEWSIDFVYGNGSEQAEHISAPFFLGDPEKSLDFPDTSHEYGAYLLPFYLYKKTGSANFVRTSWENCKNQPALEAVDSAIAGGFEAVWPDFARFNWNRDPVKDYTTWDGLNSKANPAGGVQLDVQMGGAKDVAVKLKVDLPRLSTTYKYFSFTDSTARSIAFWNGATFNLKLEEQLPIGIQYKPDTATADQKLGARVQALIKLKGQPWEVADWTNVPYMTFCRDMLSERLEELVLIFSNSEFKNRDRKLKPPGLEPVLFASNMGCYEWKGTTSYNGLGLTGGNLVVNANVTFTRSETSQGPPFNTFTASGSGSWTLSGACAGSGTFNIDPQTTIFSIFNYTPSQGTFNRTYNGGGNALAPGTVTCDRATFPWPGASWLTMPTPPLIPGTPNTRFVYVDPTGTKMIDSYNFLGFGEWKWNLVSNPQP